MFLFFNLFILFIYFWLCWVLVAACGLSSSCRVGTTLRCGARSSHCGAFSRSTGSRYAGFSICGSRAQSLWLAGSGAQAQ